MVNEIYDLFNRLETDRLEIVPRLSNRRANELLEEIQDDASISNFNLSNLSIDELVEDFRLGIDRYAIFLKNQYELIGLLSLDVSDNNDACMIAYYILPKFRRKGYAFEMLTKVCEELESKIIKAIPLKDNESSIKLLQKLDFKLKFEDEGKLIFEKSKK